MALVNMKNMLEKAKEEKYAVGQFNINNLEWTRDDSDSCGRDVFTGYLGGFEGATRYMGGYKTVARRWLEG